MEPWEMEELEREREHTDALSSEQNNEREYDCLFAWLSSEQGGMPLPALRRADETRV